MVHNVQYSSLDVISRCVSNYILVELANSFGSISIVHTRVLEKRPAIGITEQPIPQHGQRRYSAASFEVLRDKLRILLGNIYEFLNTAFLSMNIPRNTRATYGFMRTVRIHVSWLL